MPEYLAPGVFIEERPGPKTIQRVSTSTAGFVGMAERGPVRGAPKLITSFGEFQRAFGTFLPVRPDPLGEHGHLAGAVKQFFDQGGSRAFVSRAYRYRSNVTEEDHRRVALSSGIVVRLRNNVPANGPTGVLVTSLRGFVPATSELLRDEAAFPLPLAGASGFPATRRIELPAVLGDEHRADTAFARLVAPLPNNVPITAREPGAWGERVRVDVRPRTGPPTLVTAAAVAAPVAGRSDVSVKSAAAFYPGATIEFREIGAAGVLVGTAVYTTVVSTSGNSIRVIDPANGALPAAAGIEASVCEVDILVSFDATVEIFTGSWRFQDPGVALPPEFPDAEAAAAFNRRRSVWFALNRDSNTVKTHLTDPADPDYQAGQFPAYLGDDPLATHPTTLTGHPARLVAHANATGVDQLPGVPHYLGDPAATPLDRSAIEALRDEDAISIVAVPGIWSPSVQSALVNHAEDMQYRFAVLDGPRRADIAGIRGHRSNYDSTHAALYYPWIETPDPVTGEQIKIPPSGPTVGIFARSDARVGVHKAPANESVDLAQGLEARVSTGEQEVLNPEGINAIRDFRDSNRGIRVWGARTLSSDSEWVYLNVRRLFIMIENSIYKSTQWVVFEPNNDDLWGRVRSTIETFLEQLWRENMLLGQKKEDAFYVVCDRSTMSQQDIDSGRLVCEIGIAPVKPAEFVIFRIGQFTASRAN